MRYLKARARASDSRVSTIGMVRELVQPSLSPSYTITGAGNTTANGIYAAQPPPFAAGTYLNALTGLTLFPYRGTYYVGNSGTGPVLYEGACASSTPPATWTTGTVPGYPGAPPPFPHLAASGSALAPVACQSCAYTLSGSGAAAVNGCFAVVTAKSSAGPNGRPTRFAAVENSSVIMARDTSGEWTIRAGAEVLYRTTCSTSSLPPASANQALSGWSSVTAGAAPVPELSSSTAFPLGWCAPPPPPPPTPHPRCSTPECDALWGPEGCPDLNGVTPDLVRPPMAAAGVAAAAGKRVRAVAPGFEHSEAYHPLYLPTEWVRPAATVLQQQRKRRGQSTVSALYPVIVEFMGNGPFNDKHGDLSSGRPEDSNLGWGMAEPVGSKYIWISMPMLTSNISTETQVSTYWWGCPTTDARRSCGDAFDIGPTVTYLHAALKQTFELYGGDPSRVVVTGWSRGAIATGAIGLYDDATAALWKGFIPYSHLDGDCGWVDGERAALLARWKRMAGRPVLYLGECAVATEEGPVWLKKLGLNGSDAVRGMEFMTTGWANHNDAWVLRNSSARTYMRQWLVKLFA